LYAIRARGSPRRRTFTDYGLDDQQIRVSNGIQHFSFPVVQPFGGAAPFHLRHEEATV